MKPRLILLLLSISTNAVSQFNFTFPDQWTKDFRVEVSGKGGMRDTETSIRFTYDSCVFMNRVDSDIRKNAFVVTDKQRSEIFEMLKKLKSDPIGSVVVTLDKGSSSIVLRNGDGIFAVTDDTDNEEIKRDFHEVYNYLVEFAMPNGKKRRK